MFVRAIANLSYRSPRSHPVGSLYFASPYLSDPVLAVFPGQCGPFVGYTAAPGFSTRSAFTTPSMNWVPRFAIAHSDITSYSDGRWGYHEYSRWPQEFTRDAFHIHCIPSLPSDFPQYERSTDPLSHARFSPAGAPGYVLWRTIESSDWKVVDCGVIGLGALDEVLLQQLSAEVNKAIARYHRCPPSPAWQQIANFLIVCVQNTLDRLQSLPAACSVVVALAAHVQRLTLEMWGLIHWLELIMRRVQSQGNYSTLIQNYLGAHTSDPAVAQVLYRAGVPMWFQQPITENLEVYRVVEWTNLPPCFSQTPSHPRMLLAKRDLSGALNLPGEWRRAMVAIVRRQLCAARLPALLTSEDRADLPPAKRLREGAIFVGEDSASIGPPAPVLILQNPRDVKALGHELPPQLPTAQIARSSAKKAATQPSRRARARVAKQSAARQSGATTGAPEPLQAQQPHMHPARQFFQSTLLIEPPAWVLALNKASPLRQPRTSVRYFFPPPWMLDSLAGYDVPADKLSRYLLQWLSIRTFCRMRLFDQTIAGRPLTISEWRDAMWGDYETDNLGEGTSGRAKLRCEAQLNIRRLFGMANALPSYRHDVEPQFGNSAINHEVLASDGGVRARVIWDVYETNWRCELLALDALMVGSNDWSELDRWIREGAVAQVWGGSSGVDVTPDDKQACRFCWRAPPEDGWETSIPYLEAFVQIMSRWPGCPPIFWELNGHSVDAERFGDLLMSAVDFYVTTFISKYDRLPSIPVRPPQPDL